MCYGYWGPRYCVGWEHEPSCKMNEWNTKLHKCSDDKYRCDTHTEMFNAQQKFRRAVIREPKVPHGIPHHK